MCHPPWLNFSNSMKGRYFSAMKSIGVLQLVDSLNAAGKERVAVNLANLTQGWGFRSFLGTTRMDGALEPQIHEKVGRLRLARKRRYEIGALRKLIDFIQAHRIQILHAHDTSLFIASLASLFPPYPAVVWHDHDGLFGLEERPVWLYRMGARRVRGVIAVSKPLAEWSRIQLRVPSEQVWYLPNFVCAPGSNLELSNLPGIKSTRIVCVAALRPQKDHVNLLRAMTLVIKKIPSAHLLIVGQSRGDTDYVARIHQTLVREKLDKHVSFLGERQDVAGILRSCSVGVLSSAGEAFPLTLLEYGMAGLPAVATNVGQCAEILDEGRAGVLVPPGDPGQLAEALVGLLHSSGKRSILGQELQCRVERLYGPKRVVEELGRIYDKVLGHA